MESVLLATLDQYANVAVDGKEDLVQWKVISLLFVAQMDDLLVFCLH